MIYIMSEFQNYMLDQDNHLREKKLYVYILLNSQNFCDNDQLTSFCESLKMMINLRKNNLF